MAKLVKNFSLQKFPVIWFDKTNVVVLNTKLQVFRDMVQHLFHIWFNGWHWSSALHAKSIDYLDTSSQKTNPTSKWWPGVNGENQLTGLWQSMWELVCFQVQGVAQWHHLGHLEHVDLWGTCRSLMFCPMHIEQGEIKRFQHGFSAHVTWGWFGHWRMHRSSTVRHGEWIGRGQQNWPSN